MLFVDFGTFEITMDAFPKLILSIRFTPPLPIVKSEVEIF